MKRSYRVPVLILILSIVGISYYLSSRDGSYPLKTTDFTFPESTFNKVVLTDPINKVQLVKRQNTWFFENGTAVRKEAVKLLISSLYRLEATAPAPNDVSDRYQKSTTHKGVKVRVYDNNTEVKGYQLIYDSISSASYMALISNPTLFRANVQGFEYSNILPLFSTLKEYWLPNQIYNLNKHTILNVAIQYPTNKKQGFKLTVDDDEYLLHNTEGDLIADVNQEQVTQYVNFFGILNYETKITDPLLIAEITKNNTIATMQITTRNDEVMELVFFEKMMDQSILDFNKLYVLVSGSCYQIKYLNIDPILQEIDYFLKK